MKIAALVRTEDLNWSSLVRITQNIISAFEDTPQFKVFNVGSQQNYFPFLQKLSIFKPDVVYFVDNRLQHPSLIQLIETHLRVPKYIFTLYGGHIESERDSWLLLEKELIGKNITFLCASQSYLNFQKQFFNNKKSLKHLPFPVTAQKSQTVRKKNILKSEIDLIYAGRISSNKNISPLIEWIEESTLNVRLHIAGSADNLEINSWRSEGYLEYWLQEKLKKSRRSTYYGHLNQKKLYQLMKKMDVCVSLGTNFSEDFGYIMAESILQGLPIMSTNWAGYRDYYHFFPFAGVPLKVKTKRNELFLEKADFDKALQKMNSDQTSFRQNLQQHYPEISYFYSADRFKENFLSIVSEKNIFQGLTAQFKNFNRSNDINRFQALYE